MSNILENPEKSGYQGEELVNALIEEMENNPLDALRYADNYINHIPEDQRTDLLIEAIEERPDAAIHYEEYYAHLLPEEQIADLLSDAQQKIQDIPNWNILDIG